MFKQMQDYAPNSQNEQKATNTKREYKKVHLGQVDSIAI